MSIPASERALRAAVTLWGVLGVVIVLGESIYRLGATAVRILSASALTTPHLLLLGFWMIAICYIEGYRGFQLRFSPRVVARALYLAEHRRPLHVALAPLFCMALFHATRRRLLTTWYLVAGILALIFMVRHLAPIYRAIVDAGVASALAWGTAAMLVYLVKGLSGAPIPVSPDMPGDADARASHADDHEASAALRPKVLENQSPLK